MGIPIPKTLVIWASPVTVILTQIAKVIKEGHTHFIRVLGMGMPKTQECPYHCNSESKKPYTPCLWEICQWPIETASPFNIFRGKCAISPAANTPSHAFRYCKNYKAFLNKAAGSEKHYLKCRLSGPNKEITLTNLWPSPRPTPPPTRSGRHFRL